MSKELNILQAIEMPSGTEFKVIYNPNKQQTSGGDCGVYSICFTVSMMNSNNTEKTFNDFINLTLKPSFVNSLRHFIFSK